MPGILNHQNRIRVSIGAIAKYRYDYRYDSFFGQPTVSWFIYSRFKSLLDAKGVENTVFVVTRGFLLKQDLEALDDPKSNIVPTADKIDAGQCLSSYV
jgi:hypothetical protein